jgi:hypothetical protein
MEHAVAEDQVGAAPSIVFAQSTELRFRRPEGAPGNFKRSFRSVDSDDRGRAGQLDQEWNVRTGPASELDSRTGGKLYAIETSPEPFDPPTREVAPRFSRRGKPPPQRIIIGGRVLVEIRSVF